MKKKKQANTTTMILKCNNDDDDDEKKINKDIVCTFCIRNSKYSSQKNILQCMPIQAYVMQNHDHNHYTIV